MVRELKRTEIGDIPVDWEIQTFEETFKILSNNTLSRENLNNRGGAVRNIHYGDILTQFSEVLKCNEVEIPYINDLSLLSSSTQLLQDGDLIIADTAEDETVGRVTEVQCLGDEKLVAGLHTIPCRVKKGDFAPGWLGYYMNSHMYHNQIIPFITGIKVSSILKSAIAETLIVIPPVDEQKQIVKILSQMDILIQKEKKVAEKIMAVKNGCLSKMFPKDGERVPEMRLPGFCGAWEQRKFGELADYKKGPFGSAITKDMFVPKSDDSIKVYEQQNAINKDWTLERYFLPKEYALTKLKSFEVHEGDIIVSCAGTIGETYEIPENAEIGVINQALMRVRVDERVIDKKMFLIAFSNMIDDFTRTHSNGSAIKNIPPFADLKPMEVLMPAISEQKKISEYFANLDQLITLHQRKCEKYIGIKSALISTLISAKKQT